MIDKFSFIFASFALLFSFLLFFNNTQEFLGSLSAAILTAALAWIAYVLTRLVILALKK